MAGAPPPAELVDVVQEARIAHLFRRGRKSRLILGMENSARQEPRRVAIVGLCTDVGWDCVRCKHRVAVGVASRDRVNVSYVLTRLCVKFSGDNRSFFFKNLITVDDVV